MLHKEKTYKLLPLYCPYPMSWAKIEYNSSQKDLYQITTIDWAYANNIETGQTDYDFVHKNIYEVSLSDFLNWVNGLENEEIISIKKISK